MRSRSKWQQRAWKSPNAASQTNARTYTAPAERVVSVLWIGSLDAGFSIGRCNVFVTFFNLIYIPLLATWEDHATPSIDPSLMDTPSSRFCSCTTCSNSSIRGESFGHDHLRAFKRRWSIGRGSMGGDPVDRECCLAPSARGCLFFTDRIIFKSRPPTLKMARRSWFSTLSAPREAYGNSGVLAASVTLKWTTHMERRPLVQEPLRGGHIHAAPVPRWVYRPPSDSGGLSRHLIYSLPDIIVNFGTYLGYHYATRVVKNIITSSPSEPGEPPSLQRRPPWCRSRRLRVRGLRLSP